MTADFEILLRAYLAEEGDLTPDEVDEAVAAATARLGWRRRSVTLKRCGICGERLPLSSFHADRTRPDGHDYRCKECRR